MLWSMETLRDFTIRATDDRLGSVHDIYFDDARWTVRYLVVDTAWLFGRRVLISPSALGHPDAGAREIPVSLSREKIENSPDVDTAKPVGRQQEIDLHGYYGWAPYWGAGAWGAAAMPLFTYDAPVEGGQDVRRSGSSAIEGARREAEAGDPHLRSAREVTGYRIQASDDTIGDVEDFLIDEDDGRIRYLVVDTGNWLPGRKVLVSPDWVRDIDWANRDVSVDLTRQQVESSPEYNPRTELGRDYETQLHGHYQRPHYWV